MPITDDLPQPISIEDHFQRIVGAVNSEIARANAAHGSTLNPIASGHGTDLLEESILRRFVPDVDPARGGARLEAIPVNDDLGVRRLSVQLSYPGLTEAELRELSGRMARGSNVDPASIRVIQDPEARFSPRYLIEMQASVFEQNVLPQVMQEIDRVASTPELAGHYSPGGRGSAIIPIEERYTNKLNAALGLGVEVPRGLRLEQGYVTINTSAGIDVNGPGESHSTIDSRRNAVWDALAAARNAGGISKDAVPISENGMITTDLLVKISDIQAYERVHGEGSFFKALEVGRDTVHAALRTHNPNLMEAGARAVPVVESTKSPAPPKPVLPLPANAQEHWMRILSSTNHGIAQANAAHGSTLNPVAHGHGTDILEESILRRFASDIDPARGGAQLSGVENADGSRLISVRLGYSGLTEAELRELSGRMARGSNVDPASIRVIQDPEARFSPRYLIEMPATVFEQNVLPNVVQEIDRVARTPELASHYSAGGKGSAIVSVEERYTNKLNAALGLDVEVPRGLRLEQGYVTINTSAGIDVNGPGESQSTIDSRRKAVWDALAAARNASGISKDAVPISVNGMITTDLLVKISDIQAYERAHGKDSFFKAMEAGKDVLHNALRTHNPNLIADAVRGATHEAGEHSSGRATTTVPSSASVSAIGQPAPSSNPSGGTQASAAGQAMAGPEAANNTTVQGRIEITGDVVEGTSPRKHNLNYFSPAQPQLQSGQITNVGAGQASAANQQLAQTGDVGASHAAAANDVHVATPAAPVVVAPAPVARVVVAPAPVVPVAAVPAPVAPAQPAQNTTVPAPAAPVAEQAPAVPTQQTAPSSQASARAQTAIHQTGRGAGLALGIHGLQEKIGAKGTLTADKEAGGTRSALAQASVVADVASMVGDAASLAAQAAKLTETTSRAVGALAGAAEFAGKRNLVVATGAGVLGAATAIAAKDGHRAAEAIGGTVGGLAVGAVAGFAGAKAGAAIGATIGSIIPGAGTVVGAAVGSGIGAIAGFVGGYYGAEGGAKLAGSLAGDKLHAALNAPAEPKHEAKSHLDDKSRALLNNTDSRKVYMASLQESLGKAKTPEDKAAIQAVVAECNHYVTKQLATHYAQNHASIPMQVAEANNGHKSAQVQVGKLAAQAQTGRT